MVSVVALPTTARSAPAPSTPSTSVEAHGVKVAVLDLRFSETRSAVETQVTQWLQASLRGAGYEVLETHEVKKRLAGSITPSCTQGPCLVRVGKLLQVERVLVAGIAIHGSSYDILISLIDTESGAPLAQVNARCDVCNFSDVGESVARASKTLHARAQRYEGSQARLVIKTPAGANIHLDGVPLGKAPLCRLVAPGKHQLEISGVAGVSKREVVLKAGQRFSNPSMVLSPAARPSATSRSPQLKATWPSWLTLAGGGALIISGAVALALDEDCPTGICEDRRQTRGAGLALMGVGAALTATAGVLFWRAGRAGRAARAEKATWQGLSVAGAKGQLGLVYLGSF